MADVLRFLMYAEGYGQFALGREQFQALPASLTAVRCASCSNCTVECPNGVQVAEASAHRPSNCLRERSGRVEHGQEHKLAADGLQTLQDGMPKEHVTGSKNAKTQLATDTREY